MGENKDMGASLRDRATHEQSPQAVSAVPVGIPSALPHLEVRPDSNGEFDEIVARFADGMVHVETMSDKSCYVGLYWDDGRFCQWWINSKKKLRHHHESGISEPPRYTAQGVDTKPHLPDYRTLAAKGIEARKGQDAQQLGSREPGPKGSPDA